ncbi:MAG: hypothetical protein JXQ29_12880, partial [Planctomycetes bacterium]|nr:hypothetical protein [Planctomycetota bacterium]
MRLRAVLLVPALAVAALAPSFAQESPAQEPGDRVRELCEQGEEQLAAWNVRAAMSAYLRALTVQDEYDGKSGKTARPYLGLASVSLRRGEYWRAVACYDVAARKANLAVKPLAATIDGLAVVFDLVAVSATQPPFSRLGNAFAGVLSPGLHAAFQGIAGSASPAKDAAERWAETILETAQRLADPEHDLVFALAVIDAGRAILAKHAGPDPSADIKKALADLEGKVADYGERAAAAIRAEAARLSIPNSAENVPEHAAFAYRLGETWRLRWRASPGENAPARDAAACYRRCLANEPDHCSAALGLAEVLYRTDRQEQGLETVKMLVDTLLEPSPAWTGAPERPPAPRYDIASSAVDLFTMGLGGGEASPDLDSLSRWADSAALAAYLEHRPSFHPEDAATSRSDLYVRMENNAGFWLLQRWDLTRAAQFLRRSIHLQEQRNATPFPVAWQNLAHLHYLQGDFDRAMECYRNSFQQDPRNPVLANNLGALMGIFGSMTLDIERIREGVQYYRWAVELAPNYVFAKSSEDFMRRVFLTWQRYLHAGDRDPSVVASFGNSFFAAAKSLSESDDPRYLQAMQILDSGLKSMPSDEEMKRIFPELGDGPAAPEDAAVKPDSSTQKMHEIKKDMADRFALCFERGIRQYEGLLARKAAEDPAAGARNPALNFLLGEVYRVGWRRTQSPEHRTKAQ